MQRRTLIDPLVIPIIRYNAQEFLVQIGLVTALRLDGQQHRQGDSFCCGDGVLTVAIIALSETYARILEWVWDSIKTVLK